jgi:hypothetical protein
MSGAGMDQPVIRSERPMALLDKDTASGVSTQANGTDMSGYDRAAFDIIIGTAVSGAVFDAYLVESNESNLGNATNIQKASNSSAQIAITQATASANMNNTVRTLEVFRPRKRYVGVRVKVITQNITSLTIMSRKYRGSGTTPSTVTTDHEYVASAAYAG